VSPPPRVSAAPAATYGVKESGRAKARAIAKTPNSVSAPSPKFQRVRPVESRLLARSREPMEPMDLANMRQVARQMVDVHDHLVPALVTVHGERPHAIVAHVCEVHRLGGR
jgi:hypothetical protein